MVSSHQRNVSGMHAAPRCQAMTKAGEKCRKPAVKGKTRCETHGGKGAHGRNYAQRARAQKNGFRALQWQLEREVRQLEKTIRKLRRLGGTPEVLDELAERRSELLLLTGKDADELAALLVPAAIQPEVDEDAMVAIAESGREIAPDHPLRHLYRDRARGAMLGLAVGEAVGITLFREPRNSLEMEDMLGGGILGLKAGQWAGDTAAALALMESLTCRGDFDAADYMERLIDWRDKGAYSCTGAPIGLEPSTIEALERFELDRNAPTGGMTFSNGSLARMAPVAVRYWRQNHERRDVAVRQCLVTDATPIVILACAGFADILADAIADRPKSEVLSRRTIEHESSHRPLVIGGWERLNSEDIGGSDDAMSSLEAALWCVGNTFSFRDAVLAAANLGEDAGTTAAIAGQVAGALYGASAIPGNWIERLAWHDYVTERVDALFDQSVRT